MLNRKTLKRLWQEVSKREIPEEKAIVKETISRLQLEKLSSDQIKQKFEDLLIDLVRGTGFQVYLSYENKAIEGFLKEVTGPLAECIPYLGVAVTNTRRARVGSCFQLSLEYLLERCALPSERAYQIGRNDLVIPNMEVFRRRPEKAVLLQLKTTLRERWKAASLQRIIARHIVWLVTLDENPGSESIQEMESMELPIYLPSQSYLAFHTRFSKVRSLSNLPTEIESVIR